MNNKIKYDKKTLLLIKSLIAKRKLGSNKFTSVDNKYLSKLIKGEINCD